MGHRAQQHRNVVILVGFGIGGNVVDEVTIAYGEYYDGSPRLIDDCKYLAKRAIRKVVGRIYNDAGDLQSAFENVYSKQGEIMASKDISADYMS